MLQQLVVKLFEKENELVQFKKDVSKLEREISIKIQEKQMKQHNGAEENNVEAIENIGIKLEAKGIKSLLPKRQVAERNIKRVRM